MSASVAAVSLEQVGERFRDSSAGVDAGLLDVRCGLRWLGERNLLAPHGGLSFTVELVECIAGECLSSAFSLWAQLMAIEYLRHGGLDNAELLEQLRAGRLVGATAMAPALRDVAGLEPVPVLARHTATGLRLSGPIRWASNLFEDAVVVLPVRLEPGGPADPDRAVVRIRLSDPGVRLGRRPELLALNGTASGAVQLDDVEVPAEAVLSVDLRGFVGRIRPAFLLIQTAFCAGLALRSVGEAGEYLTGPNAELAGAVRATEARAVSVHQRLHAAAADPGRVGVAELLRLRLDAATTAADATRMEATVRGGAGYLASSEVSRRLREAAFLPIQSPTEGQLRWELSRYA